jgi:hypothetical protein
MEFLTGLLPLLLEKLPWLGSVLMYIGVARLILKPLMVFLHQAADATPSAKDNALLNKVQESKGYGILSFVLDYLASIKLPQKG